MADANLMLRIQADIANFEKNISSFQNKLDAASKKVGAVGSAMTKYITGPALAAGAGLFALAKKTANAGDEIQKMALRTGFSTEALSEFKHAAELSGTSIESMEKGVKRMQKVLYDAEKGLASSNDALEALGLNFEQLEGLKPEEQFSVLAGALADVENESRRAALAQEIFGRAGTEMLPMLTQGSEGIAAMRQEAHDLGIVFDQEAADASAKFNDDLLRLQKSVTGAGQELGMMLIPIIVDQFIPAIQEHVIPLVKQFVEGIINVINWFQDLDPTWKKIIGLAVAFFISLGPILVGVSKFLALLKVVTPALGLLKTAFLVLTGPIGWVVAAIAAAIAIGILLWKNWDIVKEKAAIIWQAIVGAIRGPVNSLIGFANAVIGAFENMINSVARAINRIPKFSIPSWVPLVGGKSFGLPRVPTVSLPRIPTLQTGTNYVPRDMLAMLHKGEAVVPKEYNVAHGGITININGPISSERDAENVANQIVKKLRLAGVSI